MWKEFTFTSKIRKNVWEKFWKAYKKQQISFDNKKLLGRPFQFKY